MAYLKDKSPQDRDLAIFIIDLKSAEERERFNYAEIRARPFFRRRASTTRPDLLPIRFIKPCLFFRFLFVYFIVTFINSPILHYYSLQIYKDFIKVIKILFGPPCLNISTNTTPRIKPSYYLYFMRLAGCAEIIQNFIGYTLMKNANIPELLNI